MSQIELGPEVFEKFSPTSFSFRWDSAKAVDALLPS